MRLSVRAACTTLCFLTLGWCQTSQAQKIVVNNRDDFSMAVGYSIPLGSKLVNQQPTLVANMQTGISAGIRYLTSLRGGLRVGMSLGYTEFKGWSYPGSTLFKESSILFLSVGPSIVYRTWSPLSFFGNKVNFYGALTPGMSNIKVLTNTESGINEGTALTPLEVRAGRLFVNAEAGVNYNASQNVAILFSMDYQYTSANSEIFSDKSYSFLSFKLGASWRLFKDKRYKLSY